jgi:hypothetical protein
MGLTSAFVISIAGSAVLLRVGFDVRPQTHWYLPVIGMLVLSLTGTLRGWAWPVRVLLHVGWLASLGMLAAQWMSIFR